MLYCLTPKCLLTCSLCQVSSHIVSSFRPFLPSSLTKLGWAMTSVHLTSVYSPFLLWSLICLYPCVVSCLTFVYKLRLESSRVESAFCVLVLEGLYWHNFVAQRAMLYLCCISGALAGVTEWSCFDKLCLDVLKSKKYRINGWLVLEVGLKLQVQVRNFTCIGDPDLRLNLK